MIGWFKKSVSGVLGMEVSPFGVALAYLSEEQRDGLARAECHFIEATGSELVSDITSWIEQRNLQRIGVQVVLHPTLYHLYFVDRPDVEDENLSEAVRWKIKDLVDEPLKGLVVDAFALPEDAYRGAQKKVYVVAMSRAVLREQVKLLEKLPVTIKGIGISELADRAILSYLHLDPGGAALLRLRSATGTLNIVDSGDLYLTRNIESSISILESATEHNRTQVLDELLLEVQRCVDFYDSQLGKGAIRKMLVAPTRLQRTAFDEYLSDNLGMSVHPVDLNEAFSFPAPLDLDLQSQCFAALAAATERLGAAA